MKYSKKANAKKQGDVQDGGVVDLVEGEELSKELLHNTGTEQ